MKSNDGSNEIYFLRRRTPNLRKKVYNLLTQIPEGKVTTYGVIAEALGDKRAARAIGKILTDVLPPPKAVGFRTSKLYRLGFGYLELDIQRFRSDTNPLQLRQQSLQLS